MSESLAQAIPHIKAPKATGGIGRIVRMRLAWEVRSMADKTANHRLEPLVLTSGVAVCLAGISDNYLIFEGVSTDRLGTSLNYRGLDGQPVRRFLTLRSAGLRFDIYATRILTGCELEYLCRAGRLNIAHMNTSTSIPHHSFELVVFDKITGQWRDPMWYCSGKTPDVLVTPQ
jgi:hypothetical protein